MTPDGNSGESNLVKKLRAFESVSGTHRRGVGLGTNTALQREKAHTADTLKKKYIYIYDMICKHYNIYI